jgi:hypothetical protein
MKDDTEVEGDETFSIALLPPSEMAELGQIDTVQVTIKDDDTSKCNITQSLQPAQYDLLLHLDDKPMTLTFANAQSFPEIKQVPDPQVVTLELPMIYENNAIQLKIVPYGFGETTLVIGDCASQATVHIKVEFEVGNCLQDNSLALNFSQPSVTLLENDLPVYLAAVGGQDRPRLTQAPKGEVVTLQSLTYPDYAAAGLTLVPRRAGKTEVILADCASEATLEIQVLKTGTMAYYCWLDGKTTEICEKPDIQQRIAPNSFGIDTQGNSFSPLTRFEGKIFAYQQEGENLIVLSNETGIQVKWTVLIDPAHQNQQADLLMVAKRLTPENSIEWWMFDGQAWYQWDGEDLATLIEMANESLPAILEKTVKLSDLLSENDSSGEFTLYFGYRLENGSLVFSGIKPPLMRVANNLTTSQNERFLTYFTENVDEAAITMNMIVDPKHFNSTADILMVVYHLSDTGHVKSYMRLINDSRWVEWNGDPEKITSAKESVKLTKSMRISIFTADELVKFRQEPPISSGKLLIYSGYRLEGGIIVYNGQPLEIILQ